MTKGADSFVAKLLADTEENKQLMSITDKFLQEYANDGLRTLLLAEKVIPEAEYQKWNEKFRDASLNISDREAKMEEVAQELEINFHLVGSTAIEDKLQDGVGDAIQSLKDAGIKVWVLTGDKIETAINIRYSAKLLNNDMNQMIIDKLTSHEVNYQILDFKKS